MRSATRRTTAVLLAAVVGFVLLGVAQRNAFLGLGQSERVMLVLSLLLPVLLAVSMIGPGFDYDAYRTERGLESLGVDLGLVLVAGVIVGQALVRLLAGVTPPTDIAVAAVGTYAVGFLYFRFRTGDYFRLADETWASDLGESDDADEE